LAARRRNGSPGIPDPRAPHHHPLAIRDRLSPGEARKLSTAFLEESKLPQPHSLHGILCSFPPGVELQSIGARFVGRADLLHTIHQKLTERDAGAAQLTGRIASGGGFGKTRAASSTCTVTRHIIQAASSG